VKGVDFLEVVDEVAFKERDGAQSTLEDGRKSRRIG